MLNILLASLPVLAQATYIDPSLLQQRPLLDSKPASARVIPLTLNKNLHYKFPDTPLLPSRTHLEHLQNPSIIHATGNDHSTITINIPLDASIPGSVTFNNPVSKPWPQSTSHFVWFEQDEWNTLGDHIPLLDIGARRGGMISTEAESARLDLSRPYIHVPKGLWDVLVLATKPEESGRHGEELMVDCATQSIFPDLVFGLDGEKEMREKDEEVVDELIVTPAQYVLQTEEGRCVLLVRSAEFSYDQGVVLGWAAMRGRGVVLDWPGRKIGFAL
ncbi:hypothetical protein PtrSN002B_006650 [Pyrenophora tritici-repentis]|uniref:Asp domain containing protein n=1 Tax=Pyrenophora tritici-repentis TaxID=45151 RepID=A0A2W1EAK7_9PLEO|nr:Asp domain-containing protein [Pyrenophora tritici-repentis]KAF7442877.1 Asp domain containing protein [Pyrenophora tritici-repentis]KAF7568667.1 hypothetical protein PtrM4_132800 [Pyrenophora tritici-repentis]KAG9376389.1 Asp domain containing protein [Pyrenophora tritici-repentis]KAI0581058.1 Asp domain-containing protein [Pyrenophora tritici-repentis]